jgi:multiple sugar transport system permease protein
MTKQSAASAAPVERTGARKLRKMAQRFEPYALLAAPLILMALFFFYPILYNFLLSFQSLSLFELRRGGDWVGLQNFSRVLTDPLTALSLKNTVVYLTASTVVLRLIIGLGLALLINATVLRRWKLSGLARSLLILPWVTPPVVAVAAWKWLLEPRYGAANQILIQLGIVDEGIPFFFDTSTVWGSIIAIVVWHGLPLVTVSILAGLQSIPQELYEAARVDGATRLHTFRYITLPLLAPVLAILGLLTTIWTYNNFVFVWVATGGGPGDYTQILATQLYTEAFINYRFGVGASIGVLMSLIMAVFAILYFQFVFKKRMNQT